MKIITIWHNSKCSKSREALLILKESGCESEVVKYLENSPSKENIQELLKMLGLKAQELMRVKEDIYKELNLKDETNEERLIEAMVSHPKLIERPIIIKDGKAIIGRPSSLVRDFIKE